MKIFIYVAIAAAAPLIPAGSPAAIVRVDSGRLEGVHVHGLDIYKGIPFAAAPIGDLRLRAPQTAPAWPGVRHADSFAPACMQSGVSMPGETPPKISEDCLYLNIWRAAEKPAKPLPVMVFIYGGGFMNGSAAMPLYWGDQLAKKGVMVVTFGYRIGPLGFLATSSLSKESSTHTSGNYGLLDQLAALRWVKDNIAAFGGDPNKVTIFGQSAGAMSVSLLASSPLAKGLFQGVIAESGGVFEPIELAPGWRLTGAEAAGDAYAASLNARSLFDLRQLPAESFVKDGAAAISHPVVDGYVLSQTPFAAFAAGHQSDVPTLVGSNEDEARALVDLSKVKSSSFTEDIRNAWGALPPTLMDAYPHATDEDAKTARVNFERDLRFGWDMWTWARLAAATGRSPVYYYHFTRRPPFPLSSIYNGWGASHYTELWYVFDHLGQEQWSWTPSDKALADAMSTYWTNFAKSGDPNGADSPLWPTFSGTGQVLYLGDQIGVGGVADLRTLSVFDVVYEKVRGAPVGAALKDAAPKN